MAPASASAAGAGPEGHHLRLRGIRVAEISAPLGAAFGALALAVVSVNELAGPVLFKLALQPGLRPGSGTSSTCPFPAARGVYDLAGPSHPVEASGRGTGIVHKDDEHAHRVARLYREYGPAVYHRCLRLLREPEAARDATQEVFVKLVRNADRLSDPDGALPWIYRVATNHCLNEARNARMRRRPAANEEALELAPAETPSLPDGRLARELLSRFDARTQAIAVGVLVDGLEHEELAGALGISRKTVQRTLARFLFQARALLAGGAT